MTKRRAMELLCIERACVRKGSGMEYQMVIDEDYTDKSGYVQVSEGCDRNCAECALVQDAKELLEMYDFVIKSMIEEIAKEEEEEESKTNEWRDWQRNCDPRADLVI